MAVSEEAVTPPAPLAPLVAITAEQREQLEALFTALSDPVGTVAIPVPEGAQPRAKKVKRHLKDGLPLLDPEPLVAAGACRGGRYRYVTEAGAATRLLNYWADTRCWAALDLETSVGWWNKEGEDGVPLKVWVAASDCFTSEIMLCAVSVEPGEAVVFDMRTVSSDPDFRAAFVRFLTECGLVIHNAMFDAGFLKAKFGTFGNIVYDTMIAHQLLTAGLDDEDSNLGALLKKYAGIEADKQWQQLFIKIHPESPLVNEAIAYAAADVVQLLAIMQKVHTELTDSGQLPIWNRFEKPLMRWMVEASYTGMAIDRKVFEAANEELKGRREVQLAEFQRRCPGVLASSPGQLLKWLNDHEAEIANTAEKTLLNLVARKPDSDAARVVQSLLDYRETEKMRTTYVLPYLTTLPSPIDGRIHPTWKQASTVTGRMSCSSPNVQNLPSKNEWVKLRAGFVAPPGFLLAYLDYSQFEVRALADAAREWKMIEVFKEADRVEAEMAAYCQAHGLTPEMAEWQAKSPEKWEALIVQHPEFARLVKRSYECDFHRRTASTLFKVPVDQVTKKQRADAKAITFGIPYGATARKIAEDTGLTLDEARAMLAQYKRTFPAVDRFLERCKTQAKKGATYSAAGRRRRYHRLSQQELFLIAQAVEKNTEQPEKWAALAEKWHAETPREVARQQYRFFEGAVEREGSNHPIQGANADATKLATILGGPRLKALDPDCTVIAWIHDEIMLQAPEALIEPAAQILRQAMVEGAQSFMTLCPVGTSVTIANCWGK